MAADTMMRAARFYGQKDIRIDDVPIPQVGPNQVLIEVEWCGICGSDLHEYVIGPRSMPQPGVKNATTGETLPLTLGHEISGRIASEPSSPRLKKGMGVIVDPRFLCNTCRPCQAGKEQGCETFSYVGVHGSGGLATYVVVNESQALVVPENIPLDCAAMVEPLTVAVHAIKTSGLEDFSDKDVLITGGGPVGYALIYGLRAYGARNIFVSEPTKRRREQTSGLADAVIDPRSEKVGDKCRELTQGKGVEVVFDCAGIQAGLDDGADALVHSGIIINLSIWEKPMVVPFIEFLSKELTLKLSLGYTSEDFEEVLKLLSGGKMKGYEKMITSKINLEDTVTKGFEELLNHRDDHIKILISAKHK